MDRFPISPDFDFSNGLPRRPEPDTDSECVSKLLSSSKPGASLGPVSTLKRLPVAKPLSIARDYTTGQLGPEGDEYTLREIDELGETKVSKDGYLLGERKYRCGTFCVPGRGEKLFMLATECAHVLGYRDSEVLFDKNRSLYKIVANREEKAVLFLLRVLARIFDMREVAIVTARSMFRQFGSRLVEGGRPVQDDYWETRARRQGLEKHLEVAPARARMQTTAEVAAITPETIGPLPTMDMCWGLAKSTSDATRSVSSQVSNAPIKPLTARSYGEKAGDQQQYQHQSPPSLVRTIFSKKVSTRWARWEKRPAEQAMPSDPERGAQETVSLLRHAMEEREDIAEMTDSGDVSPLSPSSYFDFDSYYLAHPGNEFAFEPTPLGPRQHTFDSNPVLHEKIATSHDAASTPHRHAEAGMLGRNRAPKPSERNISVCQVLKGTGDRQVSCFGCGLHLLRAQVPDHLRLADRSECRQMYLSLVYMLANSLRSPSRGELSPSRSSRTLSTTLSPEREQCPRRVRQGSLPPSGCSKARQLAARAQSEPPMHRCSPENNTTTPYYTSSTEASSSGQSRYSSEDTRASGRRAFDASSDGTSESSEPVAKRTKTSVTPVEKIKRWHCIYHHVLNALGRVPDCGNPRWPSPSEMYRHICEKHNLFICEKCFTTFTNAERLTDHTKGGQDPCFKSCKVGRCRRYTRTSLPRPNPCTHLETKVAQWEAARIVIHDIQSQPTRPAVSSIQDIPTITTPLQDLNSTELGEFDFIRFLTETDVVTDTIEGMDDIFPGFSVPEVPMAAIHDLAPLVVQLREELAAAHNARARAEANLNAVRHTLTRACNELAETSTLSSVARMMLQSDAPEVLYSVERTMNLRAAQASGAATTSNSLS